MKKKILKIGVIALLLFAMLTMLLANVALSKYVGAFVGKASLSLFSATYTNDLMTGIFVTGYQAEYVRNADPKADMTVVMQYKDGSTKTLAASEYTLSNADMSKAGAKMATVSYTEKGATISTTIQFSVSAVTGILVTAKKTTFNKGDTLAKDNFTVTAVTNTGTATTAPSNLVSISTVDMNTEGEKTVTVSYNDAGTIFAKNITVTVMNINVLEINYDEYDGKYHRMWWFSSALVNVSGWFAYPEFYQELPTEPLVGGNGEQIYNLQNAWHMIQRHDTDGPQNMEFLNNSNWYGMTIDNALPYTTLGINCRVGYDADFQFGYYINDDVTTLKSFEPAIKNGTEGDWLTAFGPHNGHALVQFSCYDFEPGKTYTVHWVAVFEDGIQKLTDWTVNMKPEDASGNDKAFVDTAKPNVNVILMAGQSNMFGASPLTQDVKDAYMQYDYSHVKIHYANINFNEQGTLTTYFQNNGFDTYVPGIGGQSNTHFGPELALAHALATNPELNGEEWYIIKYAAAGTVLQTQWLNKIEVDGVSIRLLDGLIDFAQKDIDKLSKNFDVKVRSFMWMQGESDAISTAYADAYATNEELLVKAVRKAFAAYATRHASALNQPGSGISFINGGIAINDTDLIYSQGGPNDWVWAETVNAGKVSNSQWLCSLAGDNANFTPATGPLAGISFKEPTLGIFTPSVQNPDQSGVIVNSIYLDTHLLQSKLLSTTEHSQYLPGDETDWAHYGAGSMIELGGLFASGMHFLINQGAS